MPVLAQKWKGGGQPLFGENQTSDAGAALVDVLVN